MNQTSWINNPKLNAINPQKLEILKSLNGEASTVKGASMESAMSVMMKANAALKAQNLSFSPEETDIIIDAMTDNMTPKEKSKVMTMKQLISTTLKKH